MGEISADSGGVGRFFAALAASLSELSVSGYPPAPKRNDTALHWATYPANLCPLLFGGEFAKFGSDFGEAVDQAVEYRLRITAGLGQRAPKHFHDMLSDLECMKGAGQIGLEGDGRGDSRWRHKMPRMSARSAKLTL